MVSPEVHDHLHSFERVKLQIVKMMLCTVDDEICKAIAIEERCF